MVTGAYRDPRCGDPSFIRSSKEILLFRAYVGIIKQETQLTVAIVTKPRDKTNHLEHKLLASDSSLFKLLYIEDIWTNEFKIVTAT